MDNWWHPDPPGTINPAKLSKGAGAAPDTFEAVDTSSPPTPSDTQTAPEAARQSVPSIAPRPMIPRSTVPLPRISSDWDPENDIVVRGNSRHQDIRKEFEDFHAAKRRPAAAKARRTSHHGYFRSQTEDGVRIRVPVDLRACPDATVVIDRVTASIYDAYLLRADIMKNVNVFRRHQVRQHACTYIDEAKPLTRYSSIDSIQPRAQNVHSLDPRRLRRAPRRRLAGNGVTRSKGCRGQVPQDIPRQDGPGVEPKIRNPLTPGRELYVR
jgi:hypothetical protein